MKLIFKNLIKIILIIYFCLNITSQVTAWRSAERELAAITDEENLLKAQNRDLEEKLKYATSSAFFEEQSRSQFGLGTSDDYWIKSE